ncbi:hypothetical protein QFC19_009216 [Naganishia cerealis]|uniref:Uncharacterized protein n=1 Tax=Naganishia cerealis TaxID=610337 RepID=A0ACC2UWD7_9TREE|nr:hypothetical protein QFC19_009216 [Naganishia cerealis]
MSFHLDSSFQPREQWLGKHLSHLPTPSVVIDRAVCIQNCKRMLQAAENYGMSFRIHIKTHKTSQGTRLQLDPHHCDEADGQDSSASRTLGKKPHGRLIISTVEEGWMLVNSGIIEDCRVVNVLYSMPPSPNTLQRLDSLRVALEARGCGLLLMVDHPAQVNAIKSLPAEARCVWTVFIKVDGGYHRAGVPVHTRQFEETVKAVLDCPETRLYGFYVHAGNSYSATSQDEAASYLNNEVQAVSEASKLAGEIIEANPTLRSKYAERSFVLSVGATPTANAARVQSEDGKPMHGLSNEHGELELHAGNYALYDLQQLATSMISEEQIALFVLSSVCSIYPGRNSGNGECLCDAGGLAMSKDQGRIPGYGKVRSDPQQGLEGWYLGRISQEHGVLTYSPPKESSVSPFRLPEYGEKLHSSLERGNDWQNWTVRDIWTPAKFW